MGEGTCEGTLSLSVERSCQAAKTSSARSQTRLLIRTSSANRDHDVMASMLANVGRITALQLL